MTHVENRLEIPQIKKKAKKENKPMQGEENDKDNGNANLFPGCWSDAVMMTGHHKKAKSQVE